MKPLAVFYHCKLSGTIPDNGKAIDTGIACLIMHGQMFALKESGLEGAAQEIHVGLNGNGEDVQLAKLFIPPKARLVVHGKEAVSEIPTLNMIRAFLIQHPDWNVLYHHIKGVTHPNEPMYSRWRERMEAATVWGWRNCVYDLNMGLDSAGAHWLTPEQFPSMTQTCFWGGTFWWATTDFLRTLPPLPDPTWANRFEAELWIGRGPRRPIVHDYFPGWPC